MRFESLRVCATDEPECRRAVLVEERGRLAGEVGVETLRPRRLRPDAVAGPRRARHRVGASPALTLCTCFNRSAR